MKTSFESDYNNGAHPDVICHLLVTNGKQSQSYGFDEWSESARGKIRAACKCPDADIFFLVGGTQANATVIDGMLATYEGVIAVQTAHINVHEAGAVEFTGPKVIALPSHKGKLDAGDLRAWLSAFFADDTAEHMVRPGMVYLTFPTELGTLYSANELSAIHYICHEYDLLLYIDGARLAYGLAASEDVTLPLLARLADIFYIGGTKCGTLCGEAVVFPKGNAPEHFTSIIKQHGALLAKGRLLGLQFDALFTDGLYFEAAKNAIDKAERLKELFRAKGFSFFLDSFCLLSIILGSAFRAKNPLKKLCTTFTAYHFASSSCSNT